MKFYTAKWRNFARRNKTALGPREQVETFSKLRIWGPGYKVNVSDDQQPEFRKPSEFYIIIFLNKLKIVENTSPKIKGLWLRLWGPSEIHGPLLGSLGPGLMYRHWTPLSYALNETISQKDIRTKIYCFKIIKTNYLTLYTFSYEIQESSQSDTRCLKQDVVSPYCGDKRMVWCCMRTTLAKHHSIGVWGKTHQCKQHKQSDWWMFIHSYYVSQIQGHILFSKDIVSIFLKKREKNVVRRLYSDIENDRTVTWYWWMNGNK